MTTTLETPQKKPEEPLILLPLMSDVTVFNRKCKNFIDETGKLGEWGDILVKAIDRVGSDCFYNKMEMGDTCKKFHLFDDKRKKQFWAYVFASIAQTESSCNPRARAPGANGIADGLLQLEYSRSLRSRSDRDEKFCKTNTPTNTQDITFQFECAASIFNDFHCGEPPRQLSSTEGYWERLRGSNNTISKLIKKFPECK